MGVSFTLPEHIESTAIYTHNYIYIIAIDNIYYCYLKGMSFMLILNYNYNKTIYNVFFSLREKEYNTKVSLSVFERHYF